MTQGKIIISSKILKTREARLMAGLQLEILGLKPASGKTCSDMIKDEYGFTGTNKQLYKQLKEIHSTKTTQVRTGIYAM